MIGVARARDRNDPRLLRQKPCERTLGRRCVLLVGEPRQPVDDRPVRSEVLRREAVEPGAKVRLGVCAVTKAALSSGCKSHPATAPAGSNRSSHGGNEMAEAFG